MTLALSQEAFAEDPALFDEEQFGSAGPEWINGEPILRELAAERLGHDATLLAIWDRQAELLNGGERSQQHWDGVDVTPLLVATNQLLPEDVQDTEDVVAVLDAGVLPAGAYKYHGAKNRIQAALARGETVRRIVTASTGNNAADTAIAAELEGLPCTVYMPEEASEVKVENTEGYGAMVVFKEKFEQALAAAEAEGEEDGVLFVQPFNHPDTIAANGLLSAFLCRQLRALGIDPDTTEVHLYAPVGGGGVAAGNAVSSKVLLPNSRFHLVQPADANPAIAQLGGEAFDTERFHTTVDGAAVMQPGKLGMQVLQAVGIAREDMHVVGLADVAEGMALGARLEHVQMVELDTEGTGSISGIPESAAAEGLAGIIDQLRRERTKRAAAATENPGANSSPSETPNDEAPNSEVPKSKPARRVHIALVTGINTDAEKIHEFATYAHYGVRTKATKTHKATYGPPRLDSVQASEFISAGNIDRRRAPSELEEAAMDLAAARQMPKRPRSGTRVASGWKNL